MFLIFDTETTGIPRDYNAPVSDTDNWPRLVQIAWQIHDDKGELVEVKNFIVKPEGFNIPFTAEKIHGISTQRAQQYGMPLDYVLEAFKTALVKAKYVIGHNIGFDNKIMECEYYRKSMESPINGKIVVDTLSETIATFCQLAGGRGGKFKWPTLIELHTKLFDCNFTEAHNAAADVEATSRCFLELVRIGVITAQDLQLPAGFTEDFRKHNPTPFQLIGLNVQPYSEGDLEEIDETKEAGISEAELNQNLRALEEMKFVHLHNHSQYSFLQSTTQIQALVKKAAEFKMPAVAVTDHGNMMSAFKFVKAVNDHNAALKKRVKEITDAGGISEEQPMKAIVGCELNVCRDHSDRNTKDNGYQIPLLAKNKAGYHNLARLSSYGFIDGFYYVPRVDKKLVAQHKEHLIATTGGLNGEVPSLILNVGEEQAEQAFLWWKEQFGEDFYAELIRHNLEEEDHVNEVLLRFCEKHNVKYFAANNSYYIEKADSESHDILLCIKEGEKKSTPIGRGRGFRYGFPNQEFYFKSPLEMKELFKDLPQAISTTIEISEKIESFVLQQPVLLPKFDIPDEFRVKDDPDGIKGENAYLRHLTFEGARERYGELDKETLERIEFELKTIENTGYPGYFLIVQDFCKEARRLGVSVGPGRGSAAGSVVAYCIGITKVDPIRYDLLFERFLNPDRVSLPDIDIDFDDEGRGKVIDYVIEKYGASQVAQIITYGKMAAKSSIRDTGRVLELPLPDTDRLAKLMPDISLNKLFLLEEKELKEKVHPDHFENARLLRQIAEQDSLEGRVLRQATALEGSFRNTGTHACGVIITPNDILQLIPVSTVKDSQMWCTQFDNSVVEDAGLLKMDFLGLKTLSLIKDAVNIVKDVYGQELDPDNFPLDDEKTYGLFQRGETVGIFQYESAGMQKYMKELKPTVFADLIAMNALYRPGPLEYIPSFIRRKHGEEPITYDLEVSREYLEETYGITVYQEQVMLLSQVISNFTKGEADLLRKAMGKKLADVLAALYPKFMEGGIANGHPENALKKIWKDWEAFAEYAFNKSHSTCYAWIAYQTAYLKANFPAAYMASVLSNNMNDIKQVTFFMEECRRMGIRVLGPDVNESKYKFTVNGKGEIRFGLGAIKGVGEAAVESIVRERERNGQYTSVFNMVERIDLRAANKKTMESLVLAGAFDSFATFHRAQYFAEVVGASGGAFLEHLLKYGNAIQQSKNAPPNLFGEADAIEVQQPVPVFVDPWGTLETLNREKEVVGLYISAHPLDDFKLEIDNFCTEGGYEMLKDLKQYINREICLAGIVTKVEHRVTQRANKPFGTLEMEDYNDSHRFFVFGEDYLKFRHFMVPGSFLFVKGKIVTRRRGDYEEPEFKISSIQLLGELREKLAKSITIDIRLEDLSEEVLFKLSEALRQKEKSSAGAVRVVFKVVDQADKNKLQMPSRSLKIDLNNETIEHLNNISEVSYSLN